MFRVFDVLLLGGVDDDCVYVEKLCCCDLIIVLFDIFIGEVFVGFVIK